MLLEPEDLSFSSNLENLGPFLFFLYSIFYSYKFHLILFINLYFFPYHVHIFNIFVNSNNTVISVLFLLTNLFPGYGSQLFFLSYLFFIGYWML